MRCSRRKFLGAAVRTACAAVATTTARRTALAQSPSAVTLSVEKIRDDVAVVSGAGGNVVLFGDAQAPALIDTGSPGAATALEALVTDSLAGQSPRLIFNTHWHEMHTGGNDVFSAAGTRIVAHENTRLWMNTEYYVDWQERNYEPRAAAALPNTTFFSSAEQPIVIEHGGESFEYAHLREAHTDGDIYVRMRDRNIIATGGVCTAGQYPVPDYATGGWIGGLIDATASLMAIADDDTLIVPGHGPVQRFGHLRRQHEMLVAVRERIEVLMREGRSAEEMIAAGVTDDFDGYWGNDRERFVTNVYGGLWWVGRLTNSL